MSSESGAKKRKCHDDTGEEGNGASGAAGTAPAVTGAEAEEPTAITEASAGAEDEMTADELRAMVAQMKIQHERKIGRMKERISRTDELEKKVEYLEGRCASLERSVELLKKESSWVYGAPEIPLSYWIEEGYYEEEAEAVDEVVAGIQKLTCALRSGGEVDGEIVECITLGCDDDYGAVTVMHDSALIPHVQELANAVQIYGDHDVQFGFTANNFQLVPCTMNMLAPALSGKNYCYFTLENNFFGDCHDGVMFAGKIMKSNPRLAQLGWKNNLINAADDMNYLVDCITSHPSIQSFFFKKCCGDGVDGYEALCSLLHSAKKFLSFQFDSNSIRTRGRTGISDYLATNPRPRIVSLQKNHLDGNDAALIFTALKQNTNLGELRLGWNDFTGAGSCLSDYLAANTPLGHLGLEHCNLGDADAALIAAGLKQNTNLRLLALEWNGFADLGLNTLCNALGYHGCTTLNSLSDSNHRCRIQGIDTAMGDNVSSINNCLREPAANRAIKIYHRLSMRNRDGTNVVHLDSELGDIPLGLVPAVLARVHACSMHGNPRDPIFFMCAEPLSIIYEISRGWKMPELYECKVVD